MFMVYYHRAKNATLLLTLFCVGLLLPFVAAAQPAPASNSFSGVEFCPIEINISAQFVDQKADVISLENTLTTEIVISNGSAYVMSGIKLGVGAYTEAVQDGVPLYWTVLSDEYQLQPGETITVPVDLDVSALPAGTHTVKVKAIQGSETAVLGILLHDRDETDGLRINKRSTQNKQTTSTVSIEEVLLSDATATFSPGVTTIKISTKNDFSVPLLHSQILAVVSEGSVPLGTAIVAEKKEPITLIPKDSQSTILRSVILKGGAYSVFSALMTEGVLQPVSKAVLSLPGENAHSWQYLSKIGITEFPLRKHSAVVACLGAIGEAPLETPYRFSELFGFSFLLQSADDVLSEGVVYSDEVTTYDYVTFAPGITSDDFSITTVLLQQPHRVEASGVAAADYNQFVKDSLAEASSVTQHFLCTDESCEEESAEAPVSTSSDKESESFWFYLGVMLAATLLMYVVLRRLDPEEKSPMDDQKLTNKELQ